MERISLHDIQRGPPIDLFELPEDVNLTYITTFDEPEYYKESFYSKAMEPVYRCLENTSNSLQVIFYYFLSVTLGAVLAVVWGIVFGVLNFSTVWIFHPMTKIFFVMIRYSSVCTRALTRMTCDPCFESAAIMYSKLRGGFHVVTVERRNELEMEEAKDIH